ncbi:glutamate receptor-interacting protein 1-like isoform X3 [Ostrea edulis]|uniref:glutamate receptor-interacting protein 1-like isoform X3 n=1 Tax=Ostrea edulis TaxID=37623 RepID=UPI0024AFDC4B|nr:glutamate receptor-interacting protein 1-like isoform X3 [Ostrea edulis]
MPGWRPDCLRSSERHRAEQTGVALVELQKKTGSGLGLIVSGGTDKENRAHISSFRPGGVAHRSDALLEGDYIVSVNGIKTRDMKHDEVISLLKNTGEQVLLEVEYQLPDTGFSDSFSVCCKQYTINLQREGKSFGFTIRGGYHEQQHKTRPLIVTQVRPGGPADREGSLKIGDRIIAINDYNVAHFSLAEASVFLQQCGREVSLLVEYDVSLMEAVNNAQGPLLIEIDKLPGMKLGLHLTQTTHQGRPCLCIDLIEPMSIADRCGALHIGDHITSIDGTSVDQMSVAEATRLIETHTQDTIKLELLPHRLVERQQSRDFIKKNGLLKAPGCLPSMAPASSVPVLPSSASTPCGFGSSNALSSAPFGNSMMRMSGRSRRILHRIDPKQSSCMSISSAATSVVISNQICHVDTVEVSLCGDHKGIGLTVEGGSPEGITVYSIQSGSVAERCGVIQEGDRVLVVNNIDIINQSAEEVNQLIRDHRHRCDLTVEFDVAESVMPSSGVFIVKLPNHPRNLGLTIKTIRGELIITSVKKGSVSYRCGSVQTGDRLLAVSDIRTDGLTIEDVMHLLQTPEDILKLKLRREEHPNDESCDESVVYTVELHRRGGPLGITISGTDSPGDPIIISDIIKGGLAEKTGAIHVGDLLLAINGEMMKGRTLTEATDMLQSAEDLVTLKIARPIEASRSKQRKGGHFSDRSTTPAASIDSAMESWDSECHDTQLGVPGNGHCVQPMVVSKPLSQTNKSGRSLTSGGSNNSYALSSMDRIDDLSSDDDLQNHSVSSHGNPENEAVEEWVRSFEDYENSEMLKQIGASLREKSTSSLDRRARPTSCSRIHRKQISHSTAINNNSDMDLDKVMARPRKSRSTVRPSKSNAEMYQNHVKTIFSPTPVQLHKITLMRSTVVEDFGFGLSDGMYEKGVYISGVRKGSIADLYGIKPFDRVLQVNGKRTKDFDCALTIPLITEAGNSLHLIISRNPISKSASLGNRRCTRTQPFRDYRSYDEEKTYENSSVISASVHSPKTV